MAINLIIIKSPVGVSVHPQSRPFEAQGGVIGRGTDSDWMLSDPERFLSSKHCQISQEGGQYYLTDLSTNGTFINGSSEPIGRGTRVALNDGDRVDLGDYRLKVSLEEASDALPVSPFADQDPLTLSGEPFPASAGLGDYAHGPESMHMSSNYDGLLGDIAPASMKVTDPLEALGGLEDGLGDNLGASGEGLLSAGSQEDSGNLLSESADWPAARAEAPLLPEDWDEDLGDDLSLSPSRQDPLSPPPPPPVESHIPHKTGPRSLPPNDSLIVSKPSVASEPSSHPSPPPDARPKPAKPAVKKAPIATPRPAKARPGTEGGAGVVDRSLVDALGLADTPLSDDQIRDIHSTVGTMMRETVEGLMQILRSRASIKNEFRMNVTTIQPQENNPIKFSANVDEVMELMFVRRSKAYKEPVVAIQESCQSIADHQVAVIAGIHSAFRAAMAKFDPLILEEEFKQSGKAGVLSGLSKGKYWSAYQDYYQTVVDNMEQSFRELFGDEFVNAYEDQLRKLASARKRDL